MRVLAAVVSVVLVVEFVLAGVAGLAGLGAARARLASLTRLDVTPVVLLVLGVVELVCVGGVVVGFWRPRPAVLAGSVLALVAGTVLSLQVRAGDRGTDLIAYGLFTGCALVLVVIRLREALV